MTTETIHTCSYECERPACIRAQRDELAARLTTETSNARGDVVAWEARDPDDGTRWVTRHARERDGWMGLGRTIRPLTYAATAPPPAAARGDVRGLVRIGDALQKMRNLAQVIRKWGTCAPLALDHIADELESALAAEGMQAGEVEERVPALTTLRFLPGGIVQMDNADFEKLRIASALSQQPEARGVVDALALVVGSVKWDRSDAVSVEVMRRAQAALTEGRNVR